MRLRRKLGEDAANPKYIFAELYGLQFHLPLESSQYGSLWFTMSGPRGGTVHSREPGLCSRRLDVWSVEPESGKELSLWL